MSRAVGIATPSRNERWRDASAGSRSWRRHPDVSDNDPVAYMYETSVILEITITR